MKTIQHTEVFNTTPNEFYDVFLNSKTHSEFTDSEVKITNKIDAEFSCYDGYIIGKNIELIRGVRIVQTWNAHDDNWPEDHDSIITLELSEVDGKTKLSFTQKEVPDKAFEAIANGWKDFYWTPLHEYFEG